MKKQLKVLMVTAVSLTFMSIPVLAASYVSSYSGPIGTTIVGQINVTEEISGGRPVRKSMSVDTVTGKTVDKITTKYDIRDKSSGELANVPDNSISHTVYNTYKHSLTWESTNSSQMDTTYSVFATHEMQYNGYSCVVYTSEDL